MTDSTFLSYCELHSKTGRHVFSAQDCRRLYELAGVPFPDPKLSENGFASMDEWTVAELVFKAREKQA